MEAIINQIHRRLLKSKKTVAAAESCTGGLLSELLTRLPGSSVYFLLGAVVYSNRSKAKILGIPPALIKEKGAVSPEVCRQMAKMIRELSGADIGIGITGIAGPAGAVPGKPVGTVFAALDTPRKKICVKLNLKGNRLSIRKETCQKTLRLLNKII